MTPKKAKAPRPTPEGVEVEAEAVATAAKVTEFRIRGEVVGRLALQNMPLRELRAVRDQLGKSWHEVIGLVGPIPDAWNLAVLVWMTKRANGHPGLTWNQFESEWDTSIQWSDIETELVDADSDITEGVDDPQL